MTRETPQNGPNRDFGARQYENMPAITDRGWTGSPRDDDSFGPAGLGGPLDARGGDAQRRDAEARTLAESTHRSMHAQPAQKRRGPKNATRSDALIGEELNERYHDDDLLDASEILLRVEDGKVLLTGEVPERWMKHRAEDIAEAVRGVVDIENRIRVDDGSKSFGAGGAVRSGESQKGSGFSSTPPNADWQARDDRVD